jgi:hypothetical protein
LVAVVINWGGSAEFAFSFNGKDYSLPMNNAASKNGRVAWSTDPIAFTVA